MSLGQSDSTAGIAKKKAGTVLTGYADMVPASCLGKSLFQ